jgi:hypothetical protein
LPAKPLHQRIAYIAFGASDKVFAPTAVWDLDLANAVVANISASIFEKTRDDYKNDIVENYQVARHAVHKLPGFYESSDGDYTDPTSILT